MSVAEHFGVTVSPTVHGPTKAGHTACAQASRVFCADCGCVIGGVGPTGGGGGVPAAGGVQQQLNVVVAEHIGWESGVVHG